MYLYIICEDKSYQDTKIWYQDANFLYFCQYICKYLWKYSKIISPNFLYTPLYGV